jgi:transposase
VVRRVEAGHSVREVAETFGISVASVVKWSQRKRQTGSAAAKPMGNRLARSLADQRDWLLSRIVEKPDVTLRALVAELNARAIATSYGSVWRLLNDEGISFKKKPARLRARPA